MIIDCHRHIVPGDIDDPSALLEQLDEFGIDKTVLMPWAGIVREADCRDENDHVARLAEIASGRIIPVGSVWPQAGADALAEMRRCLVDLGIRNFKFHPWLQGFSTALPEFTDICALAQEHRAILHFHDGTPCNSCSEQIAGRARQFPGATFVLGHSGIMWSWRSALEASKHDNVWCCLCGPHMRAIEIFCQRAATDRLLWGTDYIGNTDSIEYRLALVRSARISDEILEKVLGENAERLFAEKEGDSP